MKIKLGELLRKQTALKDLVDRELPVLASYKLSKSLKAIQDELATYKEVELSLIKKHGTPDDKGGITIEPNTPAMKAYSDELRPVLEQEVDVKIYPVRLDELGADVKFAPSKLVALIDFIIKEK